jgi:hypothetical protein
MTFGWGEIKHSFCMKKVFTFLESIFLHKEEGAGTNVGTFSSVMRLVWWKLHIEDYLLASFGLQ